VKVGDLIKYPDGPQAYADGGDDLPKQVALVLRAYKHLQKFKDCVPCWRELVDVLWNDGVIVTHDTYELEVLSESR